MRALPVELKTTVSLALAYEHFTYWTIRNHVDTLPLPERGVVADGALRVAQARLHAAVAKEVLDYLEQSEADCYERRPEWVSKHVALLESVLP